jgi:hypothetical protein
VSNRLLQPGNTMNLLCSPSPKRQEEGVQKLTTPSLNKVEDTFMNLS